jgi:hypothetical protein
LEVFVNAIHHSQRIPLAITASFGRLSDALREAICVLVPQTTAKARIFEIAAGKASRKSCNNAKQRTKMRLSFARTQTGEKYLDPSPAACNLNTHQGEKAIREAFFPPDSLPKANTAAQPRPSELIPQQQNFLISRG